jgi:hypothetical protein
LSYSIAKTLIVKHEKRFIATVVNTRDVDGTGNNASEIVLGVGGSGNPGGVGEEVVGVKNPVAKYVVKISMEGVGT